MSVGIQVIGEKILAVSVPKKEKKNGILILEDDQRNDHIVRVVSVPHKSPVKVGDKIVIGGSWQQRINYNDQELIVVLNQDILGVVDEEV